MRPRRGQRQERVVVESASECLGWSASREGAAKDSKSKGIGVARVTYTASIWVMLVLTQTPLRRRMPNAKTLVTALKIIIWDGRLTGYVISISQRV